MWYIEMTKYYTLIVLDHYQKSKIIKRQGVKDIA